MRPLHSGSPSPTLLASGALLAPLLTLAATRALKRRDRRESKRQAAEPQVVYEPPPPQLPGPSVPARWVESGDLETISGCGCRRCKG